MDIHGPSNVHASGIGMYYLCSEAISNCFGKNESSAVQNTEPQPGTARDMKILYQQPHLVEPMKLKIFEEIPTSPTTSRSSIYGSWQILLSRSFASPRSSRASDHSLRKDKVRVSRPTPLREHTYQSSPRQPGPLRLSICESEDGLPDLPRFDRFSFTEDGTLKLPEKSVTRPRSTECNKWETPAAEALSRIASMIEFRSVPLTRPGTAGSFMTVSRPPSEYDALHSHPVSYVSLASLVGSSRPAQRNENGVNILTPMQEEFSSDVHTLTMDGLVLQFPKEDPRMSVVPSDRSYISGDLPAPFPTINQGSAGASLDACGDKLDTTNTPQRHQQVPRRMQQWLSNRSRSFSCSTTGSLSTTTSFTEHRRKRAQFYQLGRQPSIQSMTLPKPLRLGSPATSSPATKESLASAHTRSQTSSTTQSDALSFGLGSCQSRDSASTVSTADVFSRASTIKSVLASIIPLPGSAGLMKKHKRSDSSQIKELAISLPMQGDIHVSSENGEEYTTYLHEIRGSMRSEVVGLAF